MATNVRRRIEAVTEDVSVTPLELFFDLVFVYALTQVTSLMAAHPSARGVLEGMVVLALVWWCWECYSWLGNAVKADEGWARAAFFAVMATMFVAALSIPESFGDLDGGLSGPLVLAICYGVARAVHLGLYAVAALSARDAGLLNQLIRFGTVMSVSVAVIVVGALVGGDAQLGLWMAAAAVDYVGTQLIGAAGWRLPSPRHFSERHGLIVIVALGESIVAIGVGVAGVPVSTSVILASVLGIALSAAMWWTYFDVTALAAEKVLARRDESERPRLARDAYTYIHLPMIAGIVVAALGLKKVLSYVGGDGAHGWDDSLGGVPLVALHLGPALFLLAMVAFRLRMIRSLGVARLCAAVLLGVSTVLGAQIGALLDLTLVCGVMVALIAFEALQYAESRRRIRHDGRG